jgi:hypothetical protein
MSSLTMDLDSDMAKLTMTITGDNSECLSTSHAWTSQLKTSSTAEAPSSHLFPSLPTTYLYPTSIHTRLRPHTTMHAPLFPLRDRQNLPP